MTDTEITILACGITLGIYLMIAIELIAEHVTGRRTRRVIADHARADAKRTAVRDWRDALTTRETA